MSAQILAFPARPSRDIAWRAALPPSISASVLAQKFGEHFLPIVQTSVDLLKEDNAEFEARCRDMQDAEGTGMIDELCQEMEIVSRQMRLFVDGLDLRRSKLRTAMSRLADTTSAP